MDRFWLLILLLAGQLQTTLPGPSHSALADKGAAAGLKCGPVAEHVFKCPKFGFTVKVPFGWVDRTEDMQGKFESTLEATAQAPADPPGSQVLLAVFERPPEVKGDTINSAIVISAERLANYPGIKSAADYFGPLSDLARERGFTIASDPYPFMVGNRQLIRGDFNREQGKLTMWQSSLVMVGNHSIVSFTFIGGSDEETDELIEGLNFSSPKPK